MDKESVLKLSYEENEVVSAQRMRFLDSSRLKMLGILGVACTAILTGQQMYYWYDKGTIPVTWFMPLIVAAIFVLVPTLVYLFAPQVDFRINSRWRHELDLHICEDKLRLTAKGKSDGFELQWSRVK